MPFDLEGARRAGASDTQIADHLASTLGFDIASARKSGADDASIASFLAGNDRPKVASTQEATPYPQIEGAYGDNPTTRVPVSAPVGTKLGAAVANIPRSVAGVARGAIGLLDPETYKGISEAARGGLGISPENAPQWEAAKQGAKDRYGNLLTTFANDPVGSGLEAYGAGKLLSGVGKSVITSNTPKGGVAKLGEKYGIPTTLGEETGSPHLQKIETITEKVPLSGMTSFRKTQLEAAQSAASRTVSEYIANPGSGNAMAENRAFASKMFNEVKDLVGDVPIDKQPISPERSRVVAQSLLDRYPDIFKKLQDTKTEGLISDIVGGTKDVKTVTPNTSKFGELTPQYVPETVTKTPKTLTFDEAWTLRQGLGEKIGQARKLLARGEIDHTAYSQLKAMFGAVSDDIDIWASKIGKPEISDAFRSANNSYKKYVVKYDILQRAYDKAAGTVGAGEMFSPKTFSTSLKNILYKDKQLNIFTAAEQQELSGVANIMQVVKRAGQFKENVPTGNRALDAALLIAAAKSPTIPISWVSTFLTTTEKGKSLARAASSMSVNSPSMVKLINSVYSSAPYLAAGQASKLNNNPGPDLLSQ